MGKLYKFNFPLSGRKNTVKQEESTTSVAPQISKAQRILGAEAIDLNICKPKRNASPECVQIPFASNQSVDLYSTRDEALENIPNISGKASLVLGIGYDDLEMRKSSAPSIHSFRSFGAVSSSSSRTPRSEDSSQRAHLHSYGNSQSSVSTHELGSDTSLAPRFHQMAHIATYIDQTMDSLPELPSDNLMNDYSRSNASRHRSSSNSYNNSRPGSSASCPVTILPQTAFLSAEPRDTYSGNLRSSPKSDNTSKCPDYRYKNKSLPYPPITNEQPWLSQPTYSTKEVIVDLDQPNISSPSVDPEEDKEGSDIVPMFLRSSMHPTVASQTDSQPTTPQAETPFLTIPDFIDLNISGPWCENGDDFQSIRSSFFHKGIPVKSDNPSQPLIRSMSPSQPIDEHYFDVIASVSSRSHLPRKLPSPRPDSAENQNKVELASETHPQSDLSRNDKITLSSLTESPNNQYLPTTIKADTKTSLPLYPNKARIDNKNIKEDAKNLQNRRVPLFIDTTKSNQLSTVSTLCTDFNSETSATLLKTKPIVVDNDLPPELDVDSNRCSSFYPSNALMEVARVGKVIRRAPVKEMNGGRLKERPALIDVRKSPVSAKLFELA